MAYSEDDIKAMLAGTARPGPASAKPGRYSEDDVKALLAKSGPAPKEGPGIGESAVRGLAQGSTLGFGDELGAAFAPLTDKVFEALNPEAKKIDPLAAYRDTRDRERAANAAAEKANPLTYGGGQLLGGVATDAALGGLGAKGLASVAGQGAAMGLGNSEADLTRGQFGKAGLDTLVGGALGAGAYGLGQGVGALAGKAKGAIGNRLQSIEQSVAAKAAAEAAAETASARSAAGRAAQDTYRQVENIRDLGPDRLAQALPGGRLPAGVADLRDELSNELARKSVRNLPGSAAEKDATAHALRMAAQEEPARAAAAAERMLSRDTAKQQVMDRVKRYALPLAGGAVNAVLGDDDSNRLARFGVGALAGRGASPTMHALRRMLQNPAVQHAGLSALDSLLPAAGPAISNAVGDVERTAASKFPGLTGWLEEAAGTASADDQRDKQLASSNFQRSFPQR